MQMNAEIINPFLEATLSVLKTMACLEPTTGKPFIRSGQAATGDVSGIVGFTGDTEGSLCLSFSKGCILSIVSKMFGEEAKEINDEVKDAVGELTNVISGDSRRRLEEIGHHFSGAVPTVITGPAHEVRHITKGPILCIPFATKAGSFVVEVCFR
jgi:chemotaxis protein CheX